MKIVQLVNGKDTGGAMTHILALLKGFDASIQVVIITIGEGPIAARGREMGLEVHCLNGQIPSQYLQLKPLMKKLGSVDLIHSHGARANLLGGIYGRMHRVPIVSSVHSDYELDYDETWLRKMIFKPMSKVALQLTHYQITISKGIKDLLISRGFREEILYSVYNGLDFSRYDPTLSKEDFIEESKIPQFEKGCVIGIITRFHPVKGLDVFVQAASKVCDTEVNAVFLIAGSGDPKVKAELQKWIDDSGHRDRIMLLGYVRPISNMLQILDINVLTSHSETFPYALLEGGYFGIPAVSSRVGGVAELITHNETGLLFQDGDVEMLSAHLKMLIHDADQRKQLGEALQKRVITEHTHIKMAEAYQEIYTHIIGRWKK